MWCWGIENDLYAVSRSSGLGESWLAKVRFGVGTAKACCLGQMSTILQSTPPSSSTHLAKDRVDSFECNLTVQDLEDANPVAAFPKLHVVPFLSPSCHYVARPPRPSRPFPRHPLPHLRRLLPPPRRYARGRPNLQLPSSSSPTGSVRPLLPLPPPLTPLQISKSSPSPPRPLPPPKPPIGGVSNPAVGSTGV